MRHSAQDNHPTPGGNGRRVYTVSHLTGEIRRLLLDGLGPVWVEGEISNLSRPASGHVYFSLKDNAAQVRCAMFRNRNRALDFEPENGIRVTVHARADLYETRGDFQLIIHSMNVSGRGELHQRFERLKRKLAREGLFEPGRKRAIPKIPRRVGVITSRDGAALHDVLTTLERRMPAIDVFVYPTPVQGAGASAAICRMLETANARREADVLVLARGGGSLEDLWPFNEERVARAIAASDLPVITGIGHDVDVTIADFAADSHAPTPTAAAQHASPDCRALAQSLAELHRRFDNQVTGRLNAAAQTLAIQQTRLLHLHPAARVEQRMQRLDEAGERLRTGLRKLIDDAGRRLVLLRATLNYHVPSGRVRAARTRAGGAEGALNLAVKYALENRRHHLERLAARLRALSPLATLKRGYSITTDKHGRIVHSIRALAAGQKVRIRVEDGSIDASVEKLLKPGP